VATSGFRARSRAAIFSGPTLAAFRIPGYPALWLAGGAQSFGSAVSLVAIGWITLQISDSAFAVGATFAARLVPALIFGIPAGSLVDRFDRRRILIVTNAAGAASLVAIAGLAGAARLSIGELILLSLWLGVIDTVRGTAAQSYAFDLAGVGGATNAIALGNLAGFLTGFVGSIMGGVVLDLAGVEPTFLVAGGAVALASIVLLVGGRSARNANLTPRLVPSFRSSMTLILRNRLVALIAIVVIVNEVLGFSALTLLPTFARDVLHTDAAGLGVLSSVRSIGSAIGLLFIARIGFRSRGGMLFILATLGSGLSLLLFSQSTVFVLSALLLVAVGVCWAMLDTLGQSLIQQSVDDSERGTAMGIWFFSIGFGPLGHLGLGASANAVGAPTALAVDGAALSLVALLLLGVKRIRNLR
jgi:MFS family permease